MKFYTAYYTGHSSSGVSLSVVKRIEREILNHSAIAYKANIKDYVTLRVPDSTNIEQVGHCNSSNKLYVQYASGGVYEYSNVKRRVFTSIVQAISKGAYISKHIVKNPEKYPFVKISRMPKK
jgi:hypothetical protein